MAHELRNALAVAESALFLAQRDIDDRARLVRHLDQVAAEIRKAHDVIGSVLGLARGEPVRREPAVVGRLVDTARHALVLPCNVAFEVTVDPADLAVSCDPILLERVLSNLYLNAVEALEGRGCGAIVTRAWRDEERTWFIVEDDGPGFDAAVVERAFEPLVDIQGAGDRARPLAVSRDPGSPRRHHRGGRRAARRRGACFWLPNG